MNFAEGSFSGKVIAITGAASGMGAACARAFSDLGGTVVIIDIDEENASTVAGEIMGEDPIIGDISDSSFCIEAIEKITERYRRLDVLVNAAGTIHRADALGTTNDDWRRVMGVNIDGMFYLSRAAVDYMAKRGSGTIVNFGSIWGGVASAGSTAYCVSKGAVHQLTRAMALDHVHQGIRINAVAPGEVRTPMLSSQRATPPSEADLQAMADATIPMKRLAEPEEIANVVVFLASNAASYMTGEIVHVDAGYTAR
ncbi:MAG: SDR family NAD(P)-dependent oxidoreductase [Acidimicrobiales bacterium]|jgi:meso-butanediol dehydrogenase/(S,S)-butanediol dehydrogenase/diacetyl reductase